MDSFSFNLFEQNKNSIQRRLNINGQSLNIQLNTQGINLMNINDFDFLEWNSKLQSGEITFDEFLEKLNELNISYQIITSHTNSNRINIQYTNNGNMYRFNVDKNIVNYLIPHQDASETDVIGSEESAEPAVRGVKSAQLQQNPDNTVKSDDEILAEYLENLFGKYEGTPRAGAEFRISKTHFADRYDGGESMMQLAQRIYNLLDELRQDENKTYLLVAHNGIARVVESYFHDMTNEEYSAAGIKNCELVEYRFE